MLDAVAKAAPCTLAVVHRYVPDLTIGELVDELLDLRDAGDVSLGRVVAGAVRVELVRDDDQGADDAA